MVDLDSSPTKLIDIVRIGKQQLLMTRGSLTTFSIANDVAKYFVNHTGTVYRIISGAVSAQHYGTELSAECNFIGDYL